MNTLPKLYSYGTKSTTSQVRFSLADLLVELEHEQAACAFSMKTLSQSEITKLFETIRYIRGKKT